MKDVITRIESIEAERAELASDVKDILAEARSSGFDVAAIRTVIRMRRQDKSELDARQAVIDEYMAALQGLADLPLGKTAIAPPGSCLRFNYERKNGMSDPINIERTTNLQDVLLDALNRFAEQNPNLDNSEAVAACMGLIGHIIVNMDNQSSRWKAVTDVKRWLPLLVSEAHRDANEGQLN